MVKDDKLKVICIKTSKQYDSLSQKTYVFENIFYYVNIESWELHHNTIVSVYNYTEDYFYFHGYYKSDCFISLRKYREQRINKILENG